MSTNSKLSDFEEVFIEEGIDQDFTNGKSSEVISEINKQITKTISENEDIEKTINFIVPKLSPRDTNDPSYTNLEIPYRIICRQRLQSSRNQMRNQIHNEIRHFELDQNKALDGVRIHRVFGDIKTHMNKKDILKLTNKQKRRLEELLAAP